MIGEKISGDSEYYCELHKIVLLEEAVKKCYCRNCNSMIVRKKVKA